MLDERGSDVTGRGKADLAYRCIERMIVFQELLPGALVSESIFMEKVELGRTPVREALQRLSRDHMVQIHPNRGVLIPPTSVESQLRLLELRRVMEALAVQLACERANHDQQRRMIEMVALLNEDTFDLKGYAETVKETHGLIVASAHNELLADAMAPLQGLSRRFWYGHVVDADAEIAAGANLHRAMLSAILDHDKGSAQQCSHALNDYLVEFTYRSLRDVNVLHSDVV